MSKFEKNAVAKSVPFDNSANGFTSTESQSAIEEAKQLASKVSRGPTICGFDGKGSTGRWLEFFSNNPSNNNPFIVAENNELIAISVSASANSTGTVTIYKNGTAVENITLTAARKNAKSNLLVSYSPLDEISARVTSGTISRPTLFLFLRTL